MKNDHKDATSQTGQSTENKKISDFKNGTTLEDEINLLLFQMLDYPVHCGKGYGHTKFNDLTAKTELPQQEITDALAKYGLRDQEGKWSSEVLSTGLILNVTFSGIDAVKNETKHYYYDLCTPHGYVFFEVFFSLLKIWNWEAQELANPIVNN